MESERVGVVDHEVAVPSELAKEEDVLISLSSIDIRGNPGPTSHIGDVACRVQHLTSPQSEQSLAVEVLPDVVEDVLRKCGIALLPDEVFATIFDLAVDRSTKGRAADKIACIVKLSHVNQQFRSILLTYPQYWTDVSSTSKPEMVKLCLSRTRGLPLTVQLNVTYFFSQPAIEFRFDPASTELISHAKIWKSLIVLYSWGHNDDEGAQRVRLLAEEQWRHTAIDTPLLEELTVSGAVHCTDDKPAFDWSKWICPKLQDVTLMDNFPAHLPGLSNISTLSLKIVVDDERLPDIFAEIVKMKNLLDLALELTSIVYEDIINVFNPFEISQVRRLRITTTVDFTEEDYSPAVKRSVFSSLFFPGVLNLVVEMKGSNVKNVLPNWADRYTRKFYFNKEINRIFRHINQFPSVESLRLDISSQYSYREDPDLRLEVYIPLNMLPSLKRVVLKSNRFFDIKEPEHPDETLYPEEDAVAPRVVGDAFPLLDLVTLDMSAYPASARWIQDYLHKTKDRRCWNASFKLTIGREDSSGRREESYVGEKALQWCNDLLSKNINEGEYDDNVGMGREVEE